MKLLGIALVLSVIVLLWMLTGCTTAKKATRYMNEHPDVSAPFCADKYPVKEMYLPGDTVITYDTLWGLDIMHDTITLGAGVSNIYLGDGNPQSQIVGKGTPKYITKTIHIIDTIVKENTAKVKDAQIQLSKQISITTKKDAQLIQANEDLDSMKDKRNWWRQACLITWVLILGYTILRIKTKLPI